MTKTKSCKEIIPALLLLAMLAICVQAQIVIPNYVESKVFQDEFNTPSYMIFSRDYSDGLGRPIQSRTRQNVSPANYVVTGTLYDDAGRPDTSLKPFTSAGDWYQSDVTGQINALLFSRISYYNDPLSRIMEKGAPGTAFYISNTPSDNHTPRYWYFGTRSNSNSINTDLDQYGFFLPSKFPLNANVFNRGAIVSFLNSQNPDLLSQFPGGNVPELFLTVIMDENNNVSQEIADIFGRTLFKSALNSDGNAIIASYGYDILDNLLRETPPVASKQPLPPTVYNYDTYGQMTSKTFHDISNNLDIRDSFEFDDAGQLIQVDRKMNSSTYSKIIIEYDRLGRVIKKQKDPTFGACAEVKYLYDGMNSVGEQTFVSEFLQKCAPSWIERTVLTEDMRKDSNARGRLTAALAINKFSDQEMYYVMDCYVYDEEGRVNTRYKFIPSLPMQRFGYAYDFMGRVTADTLTNVIYFPNAGNSGISSTVTKRIRLFSYDLDGRLAGVYEKDRTSANLLVSFIYDEFGKITKKTMHHGAADSYPISYLYDSNRDWLKEIHSDVLIQNNSFKQILSYEAPPVAHPQFSGNISSVGYCYGTQTPLFLNYNYDNINRLVNTNAMNGADPSSATPCTLHNEVFTYDVVGRITSKYEEKDGTAYDAYEPKNYEYYTNSSRLMYRNISTKGGSATYLYDYFGNMVYDASKRMVVTYDWQNLPIKFSFYAKDESSIYSYYNASANGIIDPSVLKNAFQGKTPLSQVIMLYDASGKRVIKMEKKS